MPFSPRLLWLSLLPLPPLLYDQHLRSLYPTRRVSPQLEIAARTDRPFGNIPPRDGAEPEWAPSSAGDTWTAVVPREWLTRHQVKGDSGEVGLETVFARAFWNSWPLALETNLIKAFMAMGFSFFKGRSEKEGLTEREKSDFAEGTALFGGTGLFLVEKHDAHPPTSNSTHISGPMIASFYFNWSQPGLAGGYHSLAVEDLPNPNSVQLAFVSHGVFRARSGELVRPEEGTERVQSGKDMFGRVWGGAILGEVHEAYSRLLLHCAVLRLKSGQQL